MLNFYPGNRMEDLVTLLSRLLEIPSITTPAKASVLAEDIIVVQNQGMHHWLSLELAHRRGVIMNTRFPLPGHFFWSIIKNLLGDEAIPDASPYSREILVWAVFPENCSMRDNTLLCVICLDQYDLVGQG